MKNIFLFTAVGLALSACSSNKTAPMAQATNVEVAQSIKAFEDVCLKTAPSFSGAAQAALSYGVAELSGEPSWKMGFNKDQSLGVQIKPDKECVITTPSQRSNSLTAQFLGAVSRHSNTPAMNRVPSKVNINGVPFIFQHDRKGGEAFVMLRANG